MESREVLDSILRDNADAKKLSEIIPVILRVIAAYHSGEINLPSADVDRKEFLMWSPSVLRGEKKSVTHSRPFSEVAVARLLDRLQDAGRRTPKANRQIVAAFALLRCFERGTLNPEAFEAIAKEASANSQLAIARRLAKTAVQ